MNCTAVKPSQLHSVRNAGCSSRQHDSITGALKKRAYEILFAADAAMQCDMSNAFLIHEFRKAMKHWRALLRLLDSMPGVGRRRLAIEARLLAAAFTEARDAQSALDALDDLLERKDSSRQLPPRSVQTIAGRLQERRNQLEHLQLNAERRARLNAGLARAKASIAEWPLEAITMRVIVDRVAFGYRKTWRLVPGNWATASSDQLHELRQRVVTFGCQMGLLDALGVRTRPDNARRGRAAARDSWSASRPRRPGVLCLAGPTVRTLAVAADASRSGAPIRPCVSCRATRWRPAHRASRPVRHSNRRPIAGGGLGRSPTEAGRLEPRCKK